VNADVFGWLAIGREELANERHDFWQQIRCTFHVWERKSGEEVVEDALSFLLMA
jgi:hypothetical protein